MDYLFLLAAMLASALLSIMSSLFGNHNPNVKNSSYLYTVIVTFSATVTWGVVCCLNEGIKVEAIGYSLIYGTFYTMAMIGMFKAYQIGSVSLTAFVKQLSLIVVSLWGFIFWKNTLTANVAIGIFLIIGALYLCLKPDKSGLKKTTAQWCVFAFLLLVGNAGCSITQKYQQIAFDGNVEYAFMLFGTAVSFLVSLGLYLRKGIYRPKVSKYTLVYPVIGGISSALLNLFVLRLISSEISESIIFPGIAVGGLAVTMLFSLVFYHEKLSTRQWIGLSIGVIALVFLNIK